MISFITTLYNEQVEVEDFLSHVYQFVDRLYIVDDGSTDNTPALVYNIIKRLRIQYNTIGDKTFYLPIEHTGLCELGRIEALRHVPDDSWVIMLDADERFGEGVLPKIVEWINSNPPETHMYFSQDEYLDGEFTKSFAKVKVFKKKGTILPEIIHGEPSFEGEPAGFDWKVIHRKSVNKQIEREIQYLVTYQRLLDEGKIDGGTKDWFEGMHYFVRSK